MTEVRIKKNFLYSLFVIVNLFQVIKNSIANEFCRGNESPDQFISNIFDYKSSYARRTRPNLAQVKSDKTSSKGRAEPDEIQVKLIIIAMRSMNLRRNELEATIEFKQTWHDYRLSFSNHPCLAGFSAIDSSSVVGLSEKEAERIWQPNVILRNAVDKVEQLESVVKIFGNGTVEKTQTYHSKTSCDLDLARFPYDIQKCDMLYGSWQADVGSIKLHSDANEIEALTKYGDVYPSTEEFYFVEGNVTYLNNQVSFSVILERESQYYFQFVILPVILMVIISWSSFFIYRGAAPARATLSIICFLTISNFISNQFTALPKQPSKVWLLSFMEMSLFYAFIPVVEYVACNYLYRVEYRIDTARNAIKEQKSAQSDHERIDAEQQGVGQRRKRSKRNPIFAPSYRNASSRQELEITKNDFIAYGVCKIDRIMLNQDGYMRFKDQHLDIFFRFVFPITYFIVLGTLVGFIEIKMDEEEEFDPMF